MKEIEEEGGKFGIQEEIETGSMSITSPSCSSFQSLTEMLFFRTQILNQSCETG